MPQSVKVIRNADATICESLCNHSAMLSAKLHISHTQCTGSNSDMVGSSQTIWSEGTFIHFFCGQYLTLSLFLEIHSLVSLHL